MMQVYKLNKLVTLPMRAYHPTIKFIGKRHPSKLTKYLLSLFR
jgi:hypothetical protein